MDDQELWDELAGEAGSGPWPPEPGMCREHDLRSDVLVAVWPQRQSSACYPVLECPVCTLNSTEYATAPVAVHDGGGWRRDDPWERLRDRWLVEVEPSLAAAAPAVLYAALVGARAALADDVRAGGAAQTRLWRLLALEPGADPVVMRDVYRDAARVADPAERAGLAMRTPAQLRAAVAESRARWESAYADLWSRLDPATRGAVRALSDDDVDPRRWLTDEQVSAFVTARNERAAGALRSADCALWGGRELAWYADTAGELVNLGRWLAEHSPASGVDEVAPAGTREPGPGPGAGAVEALRAELAGHGPVERACVAVVSRPMAEEGRRPRDPVGLELLESPDVVRSHLLSDARAAAFEQVVIGSGYSYTDWPVRYAFEAAFAGPLLDPGVVEQALAPYRSSTRAAAAIRRCRPDVQAGIVDLAPAWTGQIEGLVGFALAQDSVLPQP